MLDLVKLQKQHERFLAKHDEAVRDEADDAARLLVKTAKERPRFKPGTGRLQRGNKAKVIRRGGRTIIVRGSNRVKYAAPIDKGSRPHIIRPRRAKVLRFRGKNGQWVFARQVRHPGNKPYRFLYGATVAAGRHYYSSMAVRMRRIARTF